MKQEDSTLLTKYGKDSGFKVPENYFADFNQRMADMLPEGEITPVDVKPTLWQRVKPLAYLAAMFAGLWCMLSVLNNFSDTGLGGRISNIAEKLHEDKNNVDEFIMSGSVSDYDLLNYEDSVAMSNEEESSYNDND